MKKILAIAAAVLLALSVVSCGDKGKCEGCGETAKLKKYTFQGESAKLCKDCGAIVDLANSLS